MKWVALFSQSGKELYYLTQNLGVCPDITLTNNFATETWCEDIHKLPRLAIMKTRAIHNMLAGRSKCIITMHGYNRILPDEITNNHLVYNGHPGDIIKYPELKGKDPQQKALDMKLPSTGTVIHKATPELDGGDIYMFKRIDINSDWDINVLCDHLRSASVDLWTEFLRDLFWSYRNTRGGI